MSELWPNLFIVGAAKSGTTSLYHYLAQHPEVFMSPVKEPHFFSKVRYGTQYSQPVNEQQSYLKLFVNAGGYAIRGEASPSYLWCPITASRLKQKVPNAYIIAILRDPIERAHSHYLMDVQANRQPLSFSKALHEDYDRFEKGWHISNLYIELGLYAQQLQKFYDEFASQQIKVILYSDLVHEPKLLLNRLAEFLNIDLESNIHIRHNISHNSYRVKRQHAQAIQRFRTFRSIYQKLIPLSWRALISKRWLLKPDIKPAISSKAQYFLQEIYEPEIKDLEKLLKRPLPELRASFK